MLHVAPAHVPDVCVDEPEPPTVRVPSPPARPVPPGRRPAVFDALCASVEVLHGEHLPCELEVVLDRGTCGQLYRDPQIARHLMSPFAAHMPLREGCTPIGTLRVGSRRVRIYERAA